MITKEEILKAVKHCTETGGICENCPFRLNEINCELIFANYIKENECIKLKTPFIAGE